MATISPSPFPANGVRTLSPKEAMQRKMALNCSLPKDNQPSCSGQVYVGIFFDGTGNNMKADYDSLPPEKRKQSNIVRLFHTYRYVVGGSYFRHYIPGVGTPFPEIGDTGGARGGGTAAGGEQRIDWAFTRLINAPHEFVFKGVQLISDAEAENISDNLSSSLNPGAMRRVALKTWQDKLKAALAGKKPQVEQINLSVFGFSRGAAQARAFVNWLFEVCQQEGAGWTFAGLPIQLQFLGIFDTVASVGLTNLFDDGVLAGHQSWADNNLQIHPAVLQCVHYVAGHEVRACFPLDSVRVKNTYPANAVEVMYPGSHSDVGGGYAPKVLGVSPEQNSFMCIIPAVNMYHEARKAGVPLLDWNSLDKQFQEALTPSQDAIKDFNAYIKAAQAGAGPVENLHRHHMSLYFSHRFKHRADFTAREPYKAAEAPYKGYLLKTQQCLMERLAKLNQGDPMTEDFDPARAAKLHEGMQRAAGLSISVADAHLHAVAQRINPRAVTPDMERFFDRYIHDSMAGFMEMLNEYTKNGIGFVKFRTVFKGND